MSSYKFKVIGIGDLVSDSIGSIDHFPVEPGKHQYLGSLEIQPGGMFNFIIAGTRIGMEMIPMGAMGKDIYSQASLAILCEEKVNAALIRLIPGVPSKVALALVAESGKHVFLSYEGGALPLIDLDGDLELALSDADALLVLGYALNEDYLKPLFIPAIQTVTKNEGLVFFDPGPKILETSDELFEYTLRRTHYILLTSEELLILLERSGKQSAHQLLSKNLSVICIKQGAAGCRILHKDGELVCPGFQVEVKDTSAAGDSFAAAFIYGILNKWPLEKVGIFANAMGAAKVKKFGSGKNVPTLAEIHSILHTNNISSPKN